MNFRVVRLQDALDPVARAQVELFEAGGDTDPLVRAMARIDELLGRDPLVQGESREPGVRIMTEAPLTVQYEVFEEEQVVVVKTSAYRPRRG